MGGARDGIQQRASTVQAHEIIGKTAPEIDFVDSGQGVGLRAKEHQSVGPIGENVQAVGRCALDEYPVSGGRRHVASGRVGDIRFEVANASIANILCQASRGPCSHTLARTYLDLDVSGMDAAIVRGWAMAWGRGVPPRR